MNFKDSSQVDILDVLSVLSFLIGVENLEYNISQDDMQKATERLDTALREEVRQIHEHLNEQDLKLNYITSMIREMQNEKDKKISKTD